MKKLTQISDTIGGTEYTVKVYRDTEWNEYVCRLFIDGVELVNASYHTSDDKEDALDTANSMIGFYRIREELKNTL